MKMNPLKRLSRLIRGRFRRRLLSRFGIGVLAETRNGLFVVDPGDFAVSRNLLERGQYDWKEIEWLLAVAGGRPATVVVVGVHIGAVLVPLARQAGRVFGFESNPPTYKFARINVLLNGLTNVQLENCAVGLQSGTATVINNPINTGNSTISVAATGAPGGETVSMITLDRYCETKAISSIDLLLVDIEGHEFHALRGAEATLRRTANLYLEYAPTHLRGHGTNPAELVDFLLERFAYMYVFDDKILSFRAAEAKKYLNGLPPTESLLLNLLLTNRELPEAALQPARSAGPA